MARKLNKRTEQSETQQALPVDCTALYIRVSTDQQVEGFSLDEQQRRLHQFCQGHGWNVCPDHIYTDAGISGKSAATRPAFQKMLQAAHEGAVKRIVAIKLDRLARNTREFLATVDQLDKWGCGLVLIKESFDTSTPHGRFALTMFAAIAELEASQITERVMNGKREKAQQGGSNGRFTPFGYTFDGEQYHTEQDQAAAVQSIFADFTAGQSLSAIASRLNRQAVPTARGGKWYAGTVKYILRNGFYCGLSQWDGTERQGEHPAIITRKQYEDAHRLLLALKPGPVAA